MKLIVFILAICASCEAINKYSAEANNFAATSKLANVAASLRELDKPFRMAKLNLVWSKAKHRLTDVKLQSLLSDLKIHDKEELHYKHEKAQDNEQGLEEARLRKKLLGIMSTYGLLEHFGKTDDSQLLKHYQPLNDGGSNYVAKEIFSDSRLNLLWAKAEAAGFTHEEMLTLKQEFQHHQDKLDEYKSLLQDVDAGDPDVYKNSLDEHHPSLNEINHQEESTQHPPSLMSIKQDDYFAKANLLREKHLEIKSGYDNLDIRTAQGPNHQEFVDPKVLGLWQIAKQAQFSSDELQSLKQELRHYESRLLKLRHLHTQAALDEAASNNDNITKQNIKKHTSTVEKLHADLEARILERHMEL